MNAAASLPKDTTCTQGAPPTCPIPFPAPPSVAAGRAGVKIVRPAGRSILTPALPAACPKPSPEPQQKRTHPYPDTGPLLQGCKTVGLPYVDSNPTPATCKAARQDLCRRSSEALKVSGLRHRRPGLLRGASEAWQRSGGALICGDVIRGRSCTARCLWALPRDWGAFPGTGAEQHLAMAVTGCLTSHPLRQLGARAGEHCSGTVVFAVRAGSLTCEKRMSCTRAW
jgi:hypothetical protein